MKKDINKKTKKCQVCFQGEAAQEPDILQLGIP